MGQPHHVEAYPLQKHTLFLRKGDMAWLQKRHGFGGASKVLRELLIRYRSEAEQEPALDVEGILD